ncbi:cytochrome c [Verminephrobacter eiseniae]|nr:cytochrome c [Verminephrobacter eiseniae]
MPMKAFAALTLAAAASTLCAPAAAQFAKTEDAIKYRQSALFVMGQHFGRLGAMATGRMPFDAKVAQDNAELLAQFAKLPWPAFGAGTDKGAPTKARPEVWAEPAKFKEHAEKMQAETVKLAAAAQTGSLDSLKAAFGATADSCKSCHDSFRAK